MNKCEIGLKYRNSQNFTETGYRTDLALEACEFAMEQGGQSGINMLDGIEAEEKNFGNVSLTSVKVINERGSQVTGKPVGNYYTFEMNTLASQMGKQEVDIMIDEIVKIIQSLVGTEKETILVIGLGNWNVTPDALGPRVTSKLNVSRHIMGMLEEDEIKDVKTVCALSPGVLGITGIETLEVVKGVVEHVKPDVVIAIDALAARRLERICTSLQICDTGIAPGSGVGNRRMELSMETLGVPVIAIGIPTVVDALTMASDVVDAVVKALNETGGQIQCSQEDLLSTFTEMPQRLMVTPKEIDEIIDDTAALVSRSLNIALGIEALYD